MYYNGNLVLYYDQESELYYDTEWGTYDCYDQIFNSLANKSAKVYRSEIEQNELISDHQRTFTGVKSNL